MMESEAYNVYVRRVEAKRRPCLIRIDHFSHRTGKGVTKKE